MRPFLVMTAMLGLLVFAVNLPHEVGVWVIAGTVLWVLYEAWFREPDY